MAIASETAATTAPAVAVQWRISEHPVPYEDAVAAMEARVAAIRAGTEPELVWLLQHPALYTAGSSARPADLLDPDRFPVHRTGRGGQYTYHGPGQIVAYVETARGVRLRVNDPTKFHTFFSKVEISFPGVGGVKAPSRAQHIEGAQKLFRIVLPVLMEDHWPDFDVAEAQARANKDAGA